MRAALVFLLALAGPSFAQGPSTADLRHQADELLAGIERDAAALDKLQAQAAAGGSDQRAVLERRRSRLTQDVLGRVNEFVAYVVQLEKEGAPAPDLRATAERLVHQIDPIARERIDELELELAAMGVERDGAEGEARARIEARMSFRVDLLRRVLQATVGNIRNMHALGMDVTKPKEHLVDVLTDVVENLFSRLDLVSASLEASQGRLTLDAKNAALGSEVRSLQAAKNTAVSDLSMAIDMLQELGVDTTQYRQALVSATRELSTDILNFRVALGVVKQWMRSMQQAVVQNGPRWAFKLLVVGAILFAAHLLGKTVQRLVRRALAASPLGLSSLLQGMIVSAAGNLLRVVGLLIALSQIGFALGPVLAGFGIAGFIAGFALQETLANFASGVMILIYRPFDVGDLIEAGGASGTVAAMSMVSTKVLSQDNQMLIVPNGKIWRDVIKNLTAQQTRRVDLVFSVATGEDVARVERVLEGVVAANPAVLKAPAPVIKVDRLRDVSTDFVVRPWVKTPDYWDVYWAITREVKVRFDAEGIQMPQLPQDPRPARTAAR